MLLTILEASILPGQEMPLQAAFDAAAKRQRPPGLARSELLRDSRDPTRWRIQTLWASRAALDAMRGAGTPEGVLIFRAAGAEPALSVFDVVHTLAGNEEP